LIDNDQTRLLQQQVPAVVSESATETVKLCVGEQAIVCLFFFFLRLKRGALGPTGNRKTAQNFFENRKTAIKITRNRNSAENKD